MPDWEKFISRRLDSLPLDDAEKQEVIAELAGHLEDTCVALCQQGLTEAEAVRRALTQVDNWNKLRRRIYAAKEQPMKKRVYQLWIPGFLTLILSMLFLSTLHWLGVHPRLIWSGPNAILFYAPWLLALPVFGALGASLSSRAGGSPGTVLFVSAFPVLALTMAFLSMFPIGWVVEWIIGRPIDFSTVAPGILRDWIGWLLLPGAALFLGGLLVQLLFNPRPSTQSKVVC